MTALFVDLVGSTSIVEQLDPEDAGALISEVLTGVIENVDELRGTVKDLAGDGVLALFGAPTAHEDDAERAVLCGLRVVRAARRWAADASARWGIQDLAVRVGVETGPAALGPIGSGSRVEYGAVGDAVNVAARLQARANPNEVLVGENTVAMVSSRFAWGGTREFLLPGKSSSVRATPALRHEARADEQTRVGSFGLIGRSREQAVFADAWRGLTAGVGSVITLTGEPGIGKTRMLEEAAEQFNRRLDGLWLEAAAVSYADNIPYLPFRHLLLSWLRVPFDAEQAQIREAVARRAEALPEPLGRTLPAVLPVLGVAHGPDVPDPQASRRRAFSAMGDLVAALASRQPVAIALEDLQWCDPVSVDLVREIALLTEAHPLALILTSRPDPTWPTLMARIRSAPVTVHEIRLEPQSKDEARALLHAMLGGSVIPRGVEDRLLAISAGNPLFLEEQVRALVAAGAIVSRAGEWTFRAEVPFSIAPTVQRSLLARIDSLSEQSRQVLLCAAVLGERFHQSTLDAVTGGATATAVEDLLARQVIQRDAADEPTLRFRHTLVQETAYSSLPRKQRRELHARAARALRAAYAGREAEIAATLGRHLAIAEQTTEAAGLLATAARQALESFANEEAARLAGEALALIASDDSNPSGEERRRQATELMETRVAALRRQARYDEALATLAGALDSCTDEDVVEAARLHLLRGDTLKDAQRYDSALRAYAAAEGLLSDRQGEDAGFDVWLDAQFGRVSVYYWLADVERFDRVLRTLAPLVHRVQDVDQRVHYLDTITASMLRRERYAPSEALLETSSTAYRAAQTSQSPSTRGWAAFLRGLCLLMAFNAEGARPLLADSLAAAERLGDILLRARSLAYMAAAARVSHDVASTARLLEPAREAAREAGLAEYAAMADAQEAWVAYRLDDLGRTVQLADAALARWETLPTRYFVDWMACMPLLAVTLDARDERPSARALDAARRMLDDTQQRLPGAIDDALRSALGCDLDSDGQGASRSLKDALKAAEHMGLL